MPCLRSRCWNALLRRTELRCLYVLLALCGLASVLAATMSAHPTRDITIAISPAAWTTNQATMEISIEWCSSATLDSDSRFIRLNSQNVTNEFSMDADEAFCDEGYDNYLSVGEVTLSPGSNEIYAEICETDGVTCDDWTESVYYDTSVPSVSIAPAGGINGSNAVLVTVEGCDNYAYGSTVVTLNGANVNGSLTHTSITKAGCTVARRSQGTLPLPVGTSELTATVTDEAGNQTTQKVQYRFLGSSRISTTPHAGDHRYVGLCVAGCFDGTASYATPAYFSLDAPRNLAIAYRSSHAAPRGFVELDVQDTAATKAQKIALKLRRTDGTYASFTTGDTVVYFAGGSAWTRVAAEFDAASEATGAKEYVAVARFHYAAGAPVAVERAVRIIIINERASPVGAGWSIAGLERLHVQTHGAALITDGAGNASWFDCFKGGTTCDSSYVKPPGDFSALT